MTARRITAWTLGTLFGLIVLAIAVALIAINTQAGTRRVVAMAESFTGNALDVEQVEGTLAGPLRLRGVRYADANTGLDVSVGEVDVDLAMWALAKLQVHVLHARVANVDVRLGAAADEPPEPEPTEPFTLQAPIDLRVDRFGLRQFRLRNDSSELLVLSSADFVGSWIDTRISVQTLDVKSPQGTIEFAGDVQDAETYVGDGEGSFHWTQGPFTYAGTIEALARDANAELAVKLTQPLKAQLSVSLEQRESLPWQFHLTVPAFDPRESLLPDSSFESLALELKGEGTKTQGVADGTVDLNGERIAFDRLAFAQRDTTLDLEARIHTGGGALTADAQVRAAEEPVAAEVKAEWQDITVPERLAGQVLKTFGTLEFSGSAERYQAQGRVRLGPPERLSSIELNIEGTPERVQLQQFDIVQPEGRLAASGVVDLAPELGWDVTASATHFNPGEFATAWPGDLNFALATQGTLTESEPTASLDLSELRGTLRGRALSGRADLDLLANKVISGVADIRSGSSRVQLQAEPGDVMNASANFDIPALDDWLPNTGGSIQGRFTAVGNWPQTRIAGDARASELVFNDLRAASLQLNVDVQTPTSPKGSVRLAVEDATAAGLQIDSLNADARGDAGAHALELQMQGSPLATQLTLEGSQSESGWAGSMQTLVLDIENAARLALQRPVEIEYTSEQSRISEACFADGDIRLCAEGALQADGSLEANYLLEEIPFALANAFAGADSGLSFDGTIGGEGQIARNAEGALSGTARLQSSGGQIAREVAEGEGADVLLRFDDLNMQANLDGETANGEVSARLNETGSLQGRLGLSGLSQSVSELDGSLEASLPSIAVIELFAPQLANVEGAVDLRATVRGRSDDPAINGELRLNDLAADVPDVGLQLRNGTVTITPRNADVYAVEGGIQSGEGSVAFAGTVQLEGTSTVTITGTQFLAADMPGARVLVEPDLVVEHSAERLHLTGELTIPKAAINLQELPRGSGGGGAKASSDVVIVDAQTQEEEATESLPIYADVTVIVGDEVELTGFGLSAQVSGQLALQERPGEPTTGSGEVNVDGRYKAYGQDLTIREGRLLFANSPLDNPNLNLTAVRVVEDVTAGLRVTGSAKNPVLTVFSDPPMAQTEALSYLVAGKPLDQIRQSEGEGDALQTAARSLGTAAGGLLAKNVGKRLGVDEFGIKDNEMIGGAAFTVGQYLSPRLYLSYGVGLFEPGEVITLRYKLTEDLSLQAQSGTNESRAGVEYRMER